MHCVDNYTSLYYKVYIRGPRGGGGGPPFRIPPAMFSSFRIPPVIIISSTFSLSSPYLTRVQLISTIIITTFILNTFAGDFIIFSWLDISLWFQWEYFYFILKQISLSLSIFHVMQWWPGFYQLMKVTQSSWFPSAWNVHVDLELFIQSSRQEKPAYPASRRNWPFRIPQELAIPHRVKK